MNTREYLSVRRAYNLVRQQSESAQRLTFEEFAILCRLEQIDGNTRLTEIAAYQNALRPTMAHRMDHLEKRGLIIRGIVPSDRRASWVTISAKGLETVRLLARQTLKEIGSTEPLGRSTPNRIIREVDAMGSIFLTAGELLLLALLETEDHAAQIGALVEATGFLQPTTSMAVTRLEKENLVRRTSMRGGDGRRTTVAKFTESGEARAEGLEKRIEKLVVRKDRRGARNAVITNQEEQERS